MEYSRFARLVVGGTALLVGITLAACMSNGPVGAPYVVSQILVVGVMAVAVYRGRRAGTLAAILASLVYLAMHRELFASGLSTRTLLMVATSVGGYCLIGIAGGEVFMRVKYVFTGTGRCDVIDEWSQVYNQGYAARALNQALARHTRYREQYSIIIIRFETAKSDAQRPETLRGSVRSVSRFLCDDLRMIDDVARLNDGRFVVLLPHTPADSALSVAQRLADGISRTLGVGIDSVNTTSMSVHGNTKAFADFASSLDSTVRAASS